MSLTLQVWNPNNLTYLGTIDQALESEFIDEFNAPGFGQVTVPLNSADADLLTKDAVVRVLYDGAVRFSWFVETRERTLADTGNQLTLTAAGRGLLGWLEDAIVYPQAGLQDFISEERPFNYAAKDGPWKSSGNYTAAQGVTWRSDSTARAKLPVRWKDPSAQWIWKTNPEQLVQRGTVNYFWRQFTLTESKRIKFFASFDNAGDVYLDGTLIMSSSDFDREAASFSQMVTFTTRLGVGTHTLAARVRNDKPWTGYDLEVDKDTDKVSAPDHGLANGTEVTVVEKDKADGLTVGTSYFVRQKSDSDFKLATTNSDSTIVNVTKNGTIDLQLKADNTAGFILTGIELDSSGKETSTVVVRTNTAWEVSGQEPYHRPAMILRTLITEAADRRVYRMQRFTFDFNNGSPSSGSWTTEATLSLKVGSDLLTVLEDMVDLGHDFWVNPSTLELKAWESRGTDRSDTVLLDTGLNLMRFTTRVERPIKTVALVRSAAGWLRTANDDLRQSNGWRETFLEYGNIKSDAVARRAAQRVLRRTGKTQVVASGVEVAVVDGAVPYTDFTVGDVVAIPNPGGAASWSKARVLSISLKDVGGGVSFQPELEVLTDA
jgi:hypothetical protein